MRPNNLIEEAISLPLDERAELIDALLKSLSPPQTDIDKQWASVAKRRLEELRSGAVQAVPGDEVFKKIWRRFEK